MLQKLVHIHLVLFSSALFNKSVNH